MAPNLRTSMSKMAKKQSSYRAFADRLAVVRIPVAECVSRRLLVAGPAFVEVESHRVAVPPVWCRKKKKSDVAKKKKKENRRVEGRGAGAQAAVAVFDFVHGRHRLLQLAPAEHSRRAQATE